MAEQPKDKDRYKFKNVRLFKDQSLGIGSYGAVCKAKCDDLTCAAKVLHPTLFDPTAHLQIAPQRGHRLPIRRFEQECEFMSAIRHPNIVQYLGMFRDADTHLPVLLMELMDDSLTHFLETSTQPIPYHIKVNICHDIALALSFLHSNNIVHRDLSSNNVLMISNVKAKVTDFGMARLSDLNPQTTGFTNTMCPGTDVYMPPEAVQDKPVYIEKIDCFSFGVITVQVLTRQFPNPGDRLQRVKLNHPGLPTGQLLVQVPEVQRRQNHISKVDPNHPLLKVALDCLKDKDNERPSAYQLCERVAHLKEIPKYRGGIGTIQHKDETIRSLTSCIKEKDLTISSKQEKVQLLQQSLTEKDRALEERERQLRRVNQQLETSEQVIAQFERRIAELEQQLGQRDQQNLEASRQQASIKLRWKEGKRAPCKMIGWSDAAVDANTMYVRNQVLPKIYSYDATSCVWSQLPECINTRCPIVVINGWLTTVGGKCYSDYSNELFSLTGKGSDRKWTKKFPPMPTKRHQTIVLCTKTTLIVAGGMGVGSKVLSTVEVMNTETYRWSTATDLPEPVHCASATVCGDCIYMLGGIDKTYTNSKSTYACSLSALLQSRKLSSPGAHLEKTSSVDKASVWCKLTDLPVTRSTCVSFHGQLLAIGGRVLKKPTTAVYMYNSAASSWDIISHMTTGRFDCFAAVLPDNQLMVVGGYISDSDKFTESDTVGFASLYD